MTKKTFLLILIFFATSFYCNSQSFVDRYKTLTETNLADFFDDWKSYSDSISARLNISNPTIAAILSTETTGRETAQETKYVVVPRYIPLYSGTIDTLLVNFYNTQNIDVFHNEKISFSDIAEAKVETDSITPMLPQNGLYLTKSIARKLELFVGGIKDGDGNISEINKQRETELSRLIPTARGHWGGYWHFTSFPAVISITRTDQFIAVDRRTSWCTGDEIWYFLNSGSQTGNAIKKTSWVE